MNVDDVGGPGNDFARDRFGDPLRERPVGLAGEHAIQVLAVGRRVIDRAAEKRRHVRDVHHDNGSGERRRIDRAAQPLQRHDGRVLHAVRACHQREDRSRLGAVNDRERDLGASVAGTSGDAQRARRQGAWLRGDVPTVKGDCAELARGREGEERQCKVSHGAYLKSVPRSSFRVPRAVPGAASRVRCYVPRATCRVPRAVCAVTVDRRP